MRPSEPRPPARRAVENERYRRRSAAAGIVAISVRVVPSVTVPEFKAVALEWRREAKLLLERDLPSADQILRSTPSVMRWTKIPPEAFETRATAAAWLPAHERKLSQRRIHIPRHHTADK
jgi:hypothetical protein